MNELDYKVAVARGWKAWEHHSPNPYENGWKIVNKHNHVVAGLRGWETEQQAWDNALFSYNPSSDLNKAWYLVTDIPLAEFTLTRAVKEKWTNDKLATVLCESFVECWEKQQLPPPASPAG